MPRARGGASSSGSTAASGLAMLMMAASSSTSTVPLEPAMPPLPPLMRPAESPDNDDLQHDIFSDVGFIVEDEDRMARSEYWEYQQTVADRAIADMVANATTISIGSGAVARTWTVVEGIEGDEPEDYDNVGVQGFDFQDESCDGRVSFMKLLIHLWPGSWTDHLKRINLSIKRSNKVMVSVSILFLFRTFIQC